LPVLDQLAAEYADQVAFVAVAWKGTIEATAARAAELMPSGEILWGLDSEEEVFRLYGVRGQPVSVLISSEKRIEARWFGARDTDSLRDAIENLLP
jgi:hypothetical protein